MDKSLVRSTVADIQTIESRGPWTTKSNGELMVLFALNYVDLQKFFSYDEDELKRIPEDLRGFRIYTVRNLPKPEIGGGEFHRIRQELVFGLEGSVNWSCQDVYGQSREFVITPEIGVWVPPFILHTYQVREKNSGLLVIANTLYNHDDSRTHDTYGLNKFRELKKQYQ